VLDLDDLMLHGLEPGNGGEGRLHPVLVASGGRERNIELAQVLADQAAGVADAP
jgi:hypothetical protein